MPSGAKDIVANRLRLSVAQKLRLLLKTFRENGFIWTWHLAVYYLSSGMATRSYEKLQWRKLKKGLPGLSSLDANKHIWEHWDWKAEGEEWTLSPAWKDSLIRHVLCRYIRPGGDVLEIGPGAGRWTGALIERAGTLRAVDVAESSVQICRKKFNGRPGISFLVGNGKDLSGILDGSVDAVWSFDVFVHINAAEAAAYVRELRRVMRPGAVAVIHHGKSGGFEGGWRSNLTSEAFHEMLHAEGFSLLNAFQSWQDNGKEYSVGVYNDEITVFGLP